MFDDIVKPNTGDDICKRYNDEQQSNLSWECFHHEMCNNTIVCCYQKALEELQTTYASDMEDRKMANLNLMDLNKNI